VYSYRIKHHVQVHGDIDVCRTIVLSKYFTLVNNNKLCVVKNKKIFVVKERKKSKEES